jgi:hypothetical protein
MKSSKNIFKFFLFITFIIVLAGCREEIIFTDPQDLRIQYHYGFKNELNTFDKTYQKDLVMDGTVKTTFWLTSDEQEQILSKANSIKFFQFPDTIPYQKMPDGTRVTFDPDPGPQFLRIEYQNMVKKIVWFYPINYENEYTQPLLELTKLLEQIIKSKPEYKKLPPARGGYN